MSTVAADSMAHCARAPQAILLLLLLLLAHSFPSGLYLARYGRSVGTQPATRAVMQSILWLLVQIWNLKNGKNCCHLKSFSTFCRYFGSFQPKSSSPWSHDCAPNRGMAGWKKKKRMHRQLARAFLLANQQKCVANSLSC